MPLLFDITSWNRQEWQNTGGTRNKKYIQSPQGTNYYFKTSLYKPEKDYKYEFWSEIIAYEIGAILGFNVLKYDVAISNNQLGCLSEDMINQDKSILNEGIRYLVAFDNTFNPNNRSQRKSYTFQLISDSLEYLGLQQFIKNIIEIIIFDTIIGNSDRHQENWATISDNAEINLSKERVVKERTSLFDKLKVFYRNSTIVNPSQIQEDKATLELLWGRRNVRFAPIYDNGSSLARECTDDKIQNMLNHKTEFNAYLYGGKSEIHWEQQKIKHTDLIRKVNQKHSDTVKQVILRIKNSFDEALIEKTVLGVDDVIPAKYAKNKIPSERKELIVKLITLRTQSLLEEFL